MYIKLFDRVYFDKYGREWHKIGYYYVRVRMQSEVKLKKPPKKLKTNENKP